MRKIISPCGFHCIKVNHLGVWFSEQEILKDVNLHMWIAECDYRKKRCRKIDIDPCHAGGHPAYGRY